MAHLHASGLLLRCMCGPHRLAALPESDQHNMPGQRSGTQGDPAHLLLCTEANAAAVAAAPAAVSCSSALTAFTRGWQQHNALNM